MAWEAFISQFGSRVIAPIRRHPAHKAIGEDDAFWLNRALQRFIGAVGPERLHAFPNLAAVLRYLEMCGMSVLMDELRVQIRRRHVSLDRLPDDIDAGIEVEDSTIDRLTSQSVWETVMQELPDDKQRLVARLCFKEGYKPAEVFARYGERFASIVEVYRTKQTVVERLRRSPRVLELFPAMRHRRAAPGACRGERRRENAASVIAPRGVQVL